MRPIGGEPRSSGRPFRREKKPWARLRGASELLERWQTDGTWRNVTFSHTVPPHEASHAAMPEGLSANVRGALRTRGIDSLYSHQARAFELASAGKHLVVATPTASGKSLCYNLPILNALSADPSATALYLFPTKALSGTSPFRRTAANASDPFRSLNRRTRVCLGHRPKIPIR